MQIITRTLSAVATGVLLSAVSVCTVYAQEHPLQFSSGTQISLNVDSIDSHSYFEVESTTGKINVFFITGIGAPHGSISVIPEGESDIRRIEVPNYHLQLVLVNQTTSPIFYDPALLDRFQPSVADSQWLRGCDILARLKQSSNGTAVDELLGVNISNGYTMSGQVDSTNKVLRLWAWRTSESTPESTYGDEVLCNGPIQFF